MQGVPEQKLRAHLGSFGVTGNLALQPMYTLSGIFPFLVISYFEMGLVYFVTVVSLRLK